MKPELRKIYNAAARTWKKYGYAAYIFQTSGGKNLDYPCYCFVGAVQADGSCGAGHQAIEEKINELGADYTLVERMSDHAGSKGAALARIKRYFEGIR